MSDLIGTLSHLADAALQQLATLPPPKNGQVRAIPDERTIRYYASIGLLDPPVAMRGRTALYGRRHLAQVVAIKRLQQVGKSLAEIQAMWPTLDADTLARMTGVQVAERPRRAAREAFWRRPPEAEAETEPEPEAVAAAMTAPAASVTPPPVPPPTPRSAARELRLELAPGITLLLTGAAVDHVLSQLPLTHEDP